MSGQDSIHGRGPGRIARKLAVFLLDLLLIAAAVYLCDWIAARIVDGTIRIAHCGTLLDSAWIELVPLALALGLTALARLSGFMRAVRYRFVAPAAIAVVLLNGILFQDGLATHSSPNFCNPEWGM